MHYRRNKIVMAKDLMRIYLDGIVMELYYFCDNIVGW